MHLKQHGPGDMNAENASHQHSEHKHGSQNNSPRSVPRCANCDIDILWQPVVVLGVAYCCTGCAAGGPCSCDYSQYHAVNISGVIHYRPDAS